MSFHILYMYMQAEAGGQFWGSSSIALYLRLVWFDWLASELQMLFFSTHFPNWHGSQFIVLSGAAGMLQTELEDNEEKGWIGPAFLCFGLPLGEQASLPCLLVTLISYPRKMDRAFGNHEWQLYSAQIPRLCSDISIGSLGTDVRKQTLVQVQACRISPGVQVLYYVMVRQIWVRHSLEP